MKGIQIQWAYKKVSNGRAVWKDPEWRHISYIVEAYSIRYVYFIRSCIFYFKRKKRRTPK